MDANTITTLITSVGFPIVVCLTCFWYINKMQETHKAETHELSEALNNNTIVMQKLVDKLDKGELYNENH